MELSQIKINGKGDKFRDAPLNSRARQAIMSQQKRAEFTFDVPNINNATVLHNTTRKVSSMTGMDFHLHLLRHAFTTFLVEKGVDFVTVGSILGHSTLTMSLIYSHTNRERKERAVKALE